MLILDHEIIDNIFLEKRGIIPRGGNDRYHIFKSYFYKHDRDYIGGPSHGNLFHAYEEDMVHCKWCNFLGLEPIHPYRDIILDKMFPHCIRMDTYRNSIRTAEELKTSVNSRIIESILRIWMEDTGQPIYKKNELEKYCLDTYGGCFITGNPEFSIDHIKPLIMGYPLTIKNVCPLIKDINSEKRDKWPGDYYNEKEIIELSKLSGYTIEELITPQMNYPFYEWCYNNPSKWKNYVMNDRKYLREHGGKEKFLEKFMKLIDKSMTEQQKQQNLESFL
jgi:hypothetical protein